MLRLLRPSQATMMTTRRAKLLFTPRSTTLTHKRTSPLTNVLPILPLVEQFHHHHHHPPGKLGRYSSTLAATAAAASAARSGYRNPGGNSNIVPPTTAAAAIAASNSSLWTCQSQSSSHFLYQSKRFYFYIPTSWTELKLRMLRDKGETKARMVKVKLHQFWNKHYGDGAAKTKAKIKTVAASVVAANRKHGREWLEKQQQKFLVLRSNFKGRRRRFYRKRFKEPLLQWVQRPNTGSISNTMNINSSSSSISRHVDLALVGRRRGQWVVASSLPESLSDDSPSSNTSSAAPHRFVVKVREYSEASWFDAASGRPLVSRDETGRFVNPWLSQSSDGVHPISSIVKWRQIRLAREWSAWQNDILQRYIQPLLNYTNTWFSSSPIQTISATTEQVELAAGDTPKNTTKPKDFARQEEEQQQLADGTLRFTWIGHATCLLQQGDISILTDPIFSAHASPLPPLLAPFMGVARHVPPLRVSSQQKQQRRHDMNDNDKENDDTDDDGGKTVILPDKIDVCLISHDHYDHLDLPSVQQLADRVGCWVVPIGIGEFLQRHACIPAHRIVELEWWESAKLVRKPSAMDNNKNGNDNNNNNDADPDGKCEHHLPDWRCVQIHSLHKRNVDNNSKHEQGLASSPSFSMTSHQHHHHPARLDPANTNQLWITATPVQHWASRTMFDRNFRLWAGFCVFLDQQQTFFFAGDTAFPQEFPLFEQVADYIASAKTNTTTNSSNSNNEDDNDYDDNKTIVDLAALPIGAYKPRFLNHTSHMVPKDALRVHEILQCRQSVAIHHGTFCLSEEPPDEPPQLLREAIMAAAAAAAQEHPGMSRQPTAALNFVAIPHGEQINVEPVSSPKDSRIVNDDKDSHDAIGDDNNDVDVDDHSQNHACASG
jgi:L-ascorbate metabolism protein UlaG (beta-lactamase superfamily)